MMNAQLDAKALRQLSSYLTQLEDEVESAILKELEKDVTSTRTVVLVKSKYQKHVQQMLKNQYSYDSNTVSEQTTDDDEARKEYIELIIGW